MSRRSPRVRRGLLRSAGVWAVLAAIHALDVYAPLGAPPTTDAFLGIIFAIASSVFGFFRAFGGVAVTVLLQAFHLLRSGVISLARALKDGLWETGRFIARGIRSLGELWNRALKPFLEWSWRKLQALEAWLKDKFAPVVRFLRRVKDELDLIYRRFVRPVLETIEFLRQINRVLLAFHITALQTLDQWLAELESRIERPFLWIYAKITELQNWVNRIVTFDGFFQRLTLITSLGKYAPDWINQWWNHQLGALSPRGTAVPAGQKYPRPHAAALGTDLGEFYARGGGPLAGIITETAALWLVAAGRPTAKPDQ